MNNRTIAIVQIFVNSLAIFLISTVCLLVPVANTRVLAVEGPNNEPLALWWLRVGKHIVALPQNEMPFVMTIAVISIALVLLLLWLNKIFANKEIPTWVHFVSGIVPGMIMRASWRGIQNARKVYKEEMPITVKPQWKLVASFSGSIAGACTCILFILSFMQSGGRVDTVFVDVFFVWIISLVLMISGCNLAFSKD